MIWLPDQEKNDDFAVWTQHTSVTDRRTDRWLDRRTPTRPTDSYSTALMHIVTR